MTETVEAQASSTWLDTLEAIDRKVRQGGKRRCAAFNHCIIFMTHAYI